MYIFFLLPLLSAFSLHHRNKIYEGQILGYLTVNQLRSILTNLSEQKNIVGPFTIGYSYKNNPIQMIGITRIPDKSQQSLRKYPAILITSMMHSNQKNSLPLILQTIFQTLQLLSSSQKINFLLQSTVIWFIPIINIDSVLQMEKIWNQGYHKLDNKVSFYKNRNLSNSNNCFNHALSQGVDLDRNFDSLWGILNNNDPCSHNYPGTSPFSQIQTLNIKNIYEKYKIVMAIDFQCSGNHWIYPYSFTNGIQELKKNEKIYRFYERLIKNLTKKGVVIKNWNELNYGETDGKYIDWALQSKQTVSLLYKIGSDGFYDNINKIKSQIEQVLPRIMQILVQSSYNFDVLCVEDKNNMKQLLIESNSLLNIRLRIQQANYWKDSFQNGVEQGHNNYMIIKGLGRIIVGVYKNIKYINFQITSQTNQIYMETIQLKQNMPQCKNYYQKTHYFQRFILPILFILLSLFFIYLCLSELIQRWNTYRKYTPKTHLYSQQSQQLTIHQLKV